MAQSNLAIQYVDISRLLANPGNPRIHSDRQIEQLANSIRVFGFNVPFAHKRLVEGVPDSSEFL